MKKRPPCSRLSPPWRQSPLPCRVEEETRVMPEARWEGQGGNAGRTYLPSAWECPTSTSHNSSGQSVTPTSQGGH